MLQVDLQPRQIIAPVLLGVATYFIYTGSDDVSPMLAGLAALGVAVHMMNIGLRDATFKALIAQESLGTRDLIARCCTVVFDAVLLFGIVTVAGLRLPWSTFISLVIGIAIVVPIVLILMTRRARAATASQPGWALDYWAPPAFLLLMAALLSLAGTVVAAEGGQPFVTLVLISTVMAVNRSGSRLVGRARSAGFAVMAGTLILLVAAYLLPT